MNNLPASIQSAVIHHIIEQVESGDIDVIDSLSKTGFTPQQIDKLRHLQASEIVRLICKNKQLIKVMGDADNLDKALIANSNEQIDSAMQVEFVRRGASSLMMMQLFNLNSRQLSKLRTLLCIETKNGRPKLPDDDTQFKIYKAWKSLKHPNIRQKYLDLHDQFPEVPIAVLYAISVEFS